MSKGGSGEHACVNVLSLQQSVYGNTLIVHQQYWRNTTAAVVFAFWALSANIIVENERQRTPAARPSRSPRIKARESGHRLPADLDATPLAGAPPPAGGGAVLLLQIQQLLVRWLRQALLPHLIRQLLLQLLQLWTLGIHPTTSSSY